MLYYLKRYRFSLLLVIVIAYVSFFKPPSMDSLFLLPPYTDKIVHFCMYFGMSLVLWLEFIYAHRNKKVVLWHAFGGAFVAPILFGMAIELFQAFCTIHRGGNFLDAAANTAGVCCATAIGYFITKKAVGKEAKKTS